MKNKEIYYIELNCLQCSQPFQARPTDIRRGFAKYCSQSCCAKHTAHKKRKVRTPNAICAFCSQGFWSASLHKNANSKSGLRFCCKAHKDQAQRIGGIEAIQPAHYRGKTQSTDYRQFAFQHLPYQCNRCQYADKRILVVHHKDRDRTNNNLSNLEILCPNCHAIEHWFPNTK